jgi:hypothetical protein
VRTYRFSYVSGTSRPQGMIPAKNDAEFYAHLRGFLKTHRSRLDMETPITYEERGVVPYPPQKTPDSDYDSEKFLATADRAHPVFFAGLKARDERRNS